MNAKTLFSNIISKLGYKISREASSVSLKDIHFNVTYLDIGSRDGLPQKWEKYAYNNFFDLILVEPDINEVDLLKKKYSKALILPFALGSKEQKALLNVTYAQACSSILLPNYEVLNRFPVKKWFEVKRKIEIDIFPLIDLIEKYSFKIPDFVKMDVQGYESEILEGFGDCLNEVLCIELETHLFPIYQGQKTIEAITKQLDERGFYLRHLQRTGIFEDAVIEFDAYFIKKNELLKSDVDYKKIDFWIKVNKLPKGTYFKDWDKF